jgi:hypothetical protein
VIEQANGLGVVLEPSELGFAGKHARLDHPERD